MQDPGSPTPSLGLTPDFLDSVPDANVVDEIIDHVIRHTNATDRGSDALDVFPPGIRAIYSTYWIEAEVCNGGFHQFFWNRSIPLAWEAVQGFELMGAADCASVVRDAIAVASSERGTRGFFQILGRMTDVLAAFSKSHKHTSLGALDDRYYDLGERPQQARIALIRSRPDLFT